MPKVRVGDVEIFWMEAGAGDPLLLVMGLSGDHLAWAFQVPAFAERYRTLSFDNRGVGQSSQPEAAYTTRQMADDAAGLMSALGIDRAHVVGASMGGMIAQELAITHPERVRSLQLHCTLAHPDRYLLRLLDAWRLIRTQVPHEEALRTIGLWLFAPETFNDRPEFVETVLQSALNNPYPQSIGGLLGQIHAVASHDTAARLGKIGCPTLVTAAEGDLLIPPRFARELMAGIPGAKLHVFPRGGHVYFWEDPAGFNQVCLEFLAQH